MKVLAARGTSDDDESGGVGFVVRRRRFWCGPICKLDKDEICNNLPNRKCDERDTQQSAKQKM